MSLDNLIVSLLLMLTYLMAALASRSINRPLSSRLFLNAVNIPFAVDIPKVPLFRREKEINRRIL